MILQLLSGLISQQPRRIVRALVGGAAAIPMVASAVYLVRQLTRVSDSASTALLDSMGTDPYVVFMRLFGFERAPAGSDREWNVISFAPGTAGGAAGGVIVTAMAVIVVWILAFILMCSMIFRSFALIVLAAVAPVALMLMPWEKTKTWARRWCEIAVALLLAKPLAATVLAVAIKLFANSTSFAGLAAGTVGMVLACGAPLMALRLVSFAGGELAAAAQTAGGGHVLSRSSSVAARQISRQTGGRLTLASMIGRSSMTRPIQSSRAQFPTRALPAGMSVPVSSKVPTPSLRSGGPAPTFDDVGPSSRTLSAQSREAPGSGRQSAGSHARSASRSPTAVSLGNAALDTERPQPSHVPDRGNPVLNLPATPPPPVHPQPKTVPPSGDKSDV
ncbi:type IV secretion system protein [Arthrobacter sp. D1-29]